MPDRAPAYQIYLGGQPLSAGNMRNISRVQYEEAFSQTSRVEITIDDGLSFDLTPELTKLGTPIELYMGWHGQLEKMFEGELVEIGPSGEAESVDSITLTAFDYSFWLKDETNRIYTEKSYYDIATGIIEKAATVNGKSVSLTPIIDPEAQLKKLKVADDKSFEQLNLTDWEMLERIASEVNHKLLCRFNKIYIADLKYFADQQPDAHKFMFIRNPYGGQTNDPSVFSLIDYNPRVSKVGQRTSVDVVSFDPFKQSDNERTSGDVTLDRLGYTDITVKSEVKQTLRVRGIARNANEARIMAEAELKRRAEQLVKGDFRVVGNPYLKAGQKQNIELQVFGAIGKQFSGEYTLTGVRHTFSSDGYFTSFDVQREKLSKV